MRSHVTTWFGTLVLLMNTNIMGAVILLDNTGNPSTGDNLDGIIEPTAGIVVPEIPGLEITINSIGGTPPVELNSTGTSLGINSEGADDTDEFDATFNDSVALQFNQPVSITALDLVGFDAGEVFEFASLSITSVDNLSTDVVTFSEALNIAANTSFTISASTGTVGIESLTLEVVPEPAAMNLLLLGMGAFALTRARRRR